MAQRSMARSRIRIVLSPKSCSVESVSPPTFSFLFQLPQTNLIARWDYKPSADKTISSNWDKNEKVGGLTLSTEHDFGDKTIRILDLAIER